MLQEKYRVYITINKEWFYKVPESIVTAGERLFKHLNFTSADYEDDPQLRTVHYDKTVDGADIPELMSNYERFPLYGAASIAKIHLSINHERLSENQAETSSTDWKPSQTDADIASVFRVNETVKKGV